MTTQEYHTRLDAEIDQDANETLVVTELEPMSHIVILVPGTTDPVNNADVYNQGFQENRWINETGKGERKVDINIPPFAERDYTEDFTLVDLEDPAIPYEDKKLSSLVNSFANETYWQGYPDFMPSVHQFIKELKALGKPVYLVEKVRWSGDNNDDERRAAGQHVADLLLKNGPKYAWVDDVTKNQLKNERVCLHLIGHSHGGNVINEFTQALATQKPEHWSVKTIVYLSTPFFNDMHKVNGDVLDTQCDILNAYNRFDLTQRIIADYTVIQLKNMAAMAQAFGALSPVIKQLDLERLQLAEVFAVYEDGTWDKQQQKWPEAHWIPPIRNAKTGEEEKEGEWQGPQGPGVWRYMRDFFSEREDTVFGENNLSNTLDNLISEVGNWRNSSQNLLVDAKVAKAITDILSSIQAWRGKCFHSLDIRITSAPKMKNISNGYYGPPSEVATDHFTKLALIQDLNLADMIRLFAELLGFQEGINKQSGTLLSSPFFDLLDTVLMNILKKFDNTMFRPTDNRIQPVLPWRFHPQVKNLEVTAVDPYNRHQNSQHPQFLARLEQIQQRYGALPNHDSAQAKALRQQFLLVLIANAADFSLLKFTWLFGLVDGTLANLLIKQSERANAKQYLEYIKERVTEFHNLTKRQSYQLMAPRELLFKTCITLLNQNPNADTIDLFDALNDSPQEKALQQTCRQWMSWMKMQGIEVPTHHRWRYTFSGLRRDKTQFLKDLIPHWPTDWYKPNVHYLLDEDYNRLTHANDPDDPQKQNEIIYVAEDALPGSIAYLAVFSHSVSRNRLHHGPNIYGQLLQSCRSAAYRLKQTNE